MTKCLRRQANKGRDQRDKRSLHLSLHQPDDKKRYKGIDKSLHFSIHPQVPREYTLGKRKEHEVFIYFDKSLHLSLHQPYFHHYFPVHPSHVHPCFD